MLADPPPRQHAACSLETLDVLRRARDLALAPRLAALRQRIRLERKAKPRPRKKRRGKPPLAHWR